MGKGECEGKERDDSVRVGMEGTIMGTVDKEMGE